jgi:hypothetical protein
MNMWKTSKWKLWNLEEKLKKTLGKGEFLCPWISRTNILKMSVQPEPSSISMQFPENLQGHFFRNRKTNCKIIQNLKRPQITNALLNNADLKLYYRAIVTKTAWYWQRNRQIVQWNRVKHLERSLHSYSHLIVGKGAKNHSWRKDWHFNTRCWENWIFTFRRVILGLYSLTL